MSVAILEADSSFMLSFEFGVKLYWMQLTEMPPYDPVWMEVSQVFPSREDAQAFADELPPERNRHFVALRRIVK